MPEHNIEKKARFNALVLAFAQAINGSSPGIAVSLGALAGAWLMVDHPGLATLPVAGFSVGAALFALPVALIMRRVGRKRGFMLGCLVGICGAFLAVGAINWHGFALLCLAYFFIGGSNAFVQQYRFAATDAGSDVFKSKAISWVMMGGIASAFIGPQLVIYTKDALSPLPFAGAYLAQAALLGIGMLILTQYRTLFVADHESVNASIDDTQYMEESPQTGRALSIIICQPVFIVALICAIASFAMMTFMMTGAPLAMTRAGHSQHQAVSGIQWHILAMYGPSFFTGRLIVRFGKLRVIAIGLCLLSLCAFTALSGWKLWNFWGALILLGAGWNMGFIGATALLDEAYRPAEKNKTQGLHDLILFSCVAISALVSGVVLQTWGWHGIAIILFPVLSIAALSLAYLAFTGRPAMETEMSEGL